MLLDLNSYNLLLTTIGATIDSLLNFTNLVFYGNINLIFENITTYINLLNLWLTDDEMYTTRIDVLIAFYSNNSYINVLKEVYNVCPSIYAFDYLHLFYLKQVIFKSYLSFYEASLLKYTKPITVSLHLDLFFPNLFNKWGYFLFCFGLGFFLTNVINFRFQYGLNFYLNYFKLLSDIGEQEYGSYDDFKFFLFILVQMLIWYCWIVFIGYTFSLQSEGKLILLTLSIIISILTIPVRLVWDLGLAFGMYIRGAASSTNLVIEAFFDLIGVIIIFTRFIVQNIRFLMVFVALFELFEWSFGSSEISCILQFNLNLYNSINFFSTITPMSIFTFLIFTLKLCILYLYHLLHLIIVSFMQVGVFFMVSFWLFFFLYTSFFKITSDYYFYAKRI